MPPRPAPFRFAAPPGLALVAVLAGPVAGLAATPLSTAAAQHGAAQPSADVEAAGAAAALAEAQDRAARAAAATDELKRALTPGHLTDPMPETDRTFGLASLRADYADAQRRAAGYRATLGDRHPTLTATEQMMEDLRGQLLDATRKALASAERDRTEARADIAAAERRLDAATSPRTEPAATRAPAAGPSDAEITGSVAALPRPAARMTSPLSLPPAAAVEPPARGEASGTRPAAPVHASLHELVLILAAAVAALLVAAWSGLKLLRARRSPVAPVRTRRVEPALASPSAADPVSEAPASPDGSVPVLQRLALPRSGEEGETSQSAATDLHATLRAAFDETGQGRMTVLLAPVAGLPDRDADATAVALALAAAAAGRRPLLMEARTAGRLRGALVPIGAVPMLVEAGGVVRTLYRLGPAEAPAALLPSDAGEAEAAAAAGTRRDTVRLKGLDAFDTVILVGDDAAALAASADLVLLAAPEGTSQSALAEAARPLDGAGRPCGAVLVAAPAAEAGPAARGTPLPRRRTAPAAASAARIGLRGSIEPSRRRLA